MCFLSISELCVLYGPTQQNDFEEHLDCCEYDRIVRMMQQFDMTSSSTVLSMDFLVSYSLIAKSLNF